MKVTRYLIAFAVCSGETIVLLFVIHSVTLEVAGTALFSMQNFNDAFFRTLAVLAYQKAIDSKTQFLIGYLLADLFKIWNEKYVTLCYNVIQSIAVPFEHCVFRDLFDCSSI